MLDLLSTLVSATVNGLQLKDRLTAWFGRSGYRKGRSIDEYGARVADLREQVADALDWGADQADQPREYPDGMSARLFAYRFGFSDLHAVEEIEAGRRPLTRSDLDQLGTQTGVSQRHLIDGSEPLWAPFVERADDPLGALAVIDDEVRSVTAVRVDAPDGEVALIVDRGDWRTVKVVHLLGFHFGSAVGGGGRARQESLFWLRAALGPEFLVPEACGPIVDRIRDEAGLLERDTDLWGRVTSRERFERLSRGDEHPYAFLRRGHFMNDHWFFDFVDLLGTSRAAPSYEREFGEQFIMVQRNVRHQLGLGEPAVPTARNRSDDDVMCVGAELSVPVARSRLRAFVRSRFPEDQRLALTTFGRFAVVLPCLVGLGAQLYVHATNLLASLKTGQLPSDDLGLAPLLTVLAFAGFVGAVIYLLLPRRMPWFLPASAPPWYA